MNGERASFEAGSISLEPLDISRDCELSAIKAIYQNEFPNSERKPTSYLAETSARVDSGVFVASIKDSIVGFALVRGLTSVDARLLEYMAISERHQSLGYGRKMLDLVIGIESNPMVAEVERPLDCARNSIETRRVKFYLRGGFRMISGFDYRMPKIMDESPPDMRLLIHGYPKPDISGMQLRKLVDAIYREVYDVFSYPNFEPEPTARFELSDDRGS